ncbi:MAG TPA: beta-phosphoglucomutase [Firmicutes bacterium]|jgi:kojibiose phosphorylase|nr:beta-phosphoglucomutase [Bacillota bacterium]HAW69745.1 beta-phosphoglucomutase [Bacillota bacterium]HAZ20775.1 beta-phosphoglucomutase [Bacillota bacterium]HBE06043.1 beta-phosphoglucomutase [Bacillota bacterium]HBG44286.1 beta-phosphoglucomutase [Bacillota bacterium]
MTNKIRAFIFDLDGVLTDTAEYHFRAWQQLALEEGLPFDRQDNEKLRGISRRESLLTIMNGRPTSEARLTDMMERKNSYYVAALQTMSRDDALLPGSIAILTELRQQGFKMAIASSSKNTRTVLARLELEEYFDAVADGYSVAQAKPAPDIFMHAAQLLAVPPQQCVVIEDAAAGVAGGLAAGMIVVGLGPAERVGKAHFVFPSLAEVQLDMILDRDEQH